MDRRSFIVRAGALTSLAFLDPLKFIKIVGAAEKVPKKFNLNIFRTQWQMPATQDVLIAHLLVKFRADLVDLGYTKDFNYYCLATITREEQVENPGGLVEVKKAKIDQADHILRTHLTEVLERNLLGYAPVESPSDWVNAKEEAEINAPYERVTVERDDFHGWLVRVKDVESYNSSKNRWEPV